jgi:GNAT superfamily N-acetyltransferase
MQILNISPKELDYVAILCVDPSLPPKWRKEMKKPMEARKEWLKSMMKKGLQVLVALEKSEDVLDSLNAKNQKIEELNVRGKIPKGLIEYLPIEFALEPVKGKSSLFINCIWVFPSFWHSGIAKRLLKTLIDNAKPHGGVSVLAYEGDKWFDYFPYMPVNFFKKFGFKEVDREGSRVLLYFDLGAHKPPKLIPPKNKAIKKGDKLVLDIFYNSQCPWSKWMLEKIKQNMEKYNAIINAINTDDRKVIEKYGMARGVYINGEPVIKRMALWREVEKIIKQKLQH